MRAIKQTAQTTLDVWEVFNHPLRSYILNRVPEPSSADDILQEVFLKIHTRLHTLRDEEKLPAWLYQIARNAIADHYRAGRCWEEMPESFDVEDGPAEADAGMELAEQMRYYVKACLPAKYAEALMLSDIEGLAQQELAARLGLSLSGAKSRVQRARRMLREAFMRCCHFEFDRRGNIIDYGPRGCDAVRCD